MHLRNEFLERDFRNNMSSNNRPFSIKLFVPSGDPDDLRIIEKSNWTGVGVVVKRASYKSLSKRAEADRTGVYILVGTSEDGLIPQVYIGEGEPVRRRLNAHYRNKEFWEWAVFFVTKDESLNKAHVKYLEARLLDLAGKAKLSIIENSGSSLPANLSEADVADVESFLEDMLTILPIIGLPIFERTVFIEADSSLLRLHSQKVSATGYESPGGFVVRECSQAVTTESAVIHQYMKNKRLELLNNGVLVEKDGLYIFTQDYTFGSPSTASGVILGRADNGRTSWRTEDGVTLKEIQESLIQD